MTDAAMMTAAEAAAKFPALAALSFEGLKRAGLEGERLSAGGINDERHGAWLCAVWTLVDAEREARAAAAEDAAWKEHEPIITQGQLDAIAVAH